MLPGTGDWVASEVNKALEELKNKNSGICMAHISAFYYLLNKELDFYPEVVKHVKELARWDRMEHIACGEYDMYGETAIFLDDDIEKNTKRLKEEFKEDYTVDIRFLLIKYLKDLKDLENFMKTILLREDTKWEEWIYIDLYFKDGTIFMLKDEKDPELTLHVDLNFDIDNSKLMFRKRTFLVSTDAINKALKEDIFSEYLYRILKIAKDVEGVIKKTHKSFGGATINLIVRSSGDVFVENVWDIAPMETTEKLLERIEEIVRNNRLSLSDLLREKAVEHMQGLTL